MASPVVKRIWSPNWSSRPNGKADVLGVVLHHTVSGGKSALAVAQFFARREAGVSAHFVQGDEGLTIQCVPLYRAAWHAGPAHYDWDYDGRIEPGHGETSVNTHSVGIEVCNWGDNEDDFPDAQVRKTASIIRWCDSECPNLRLRDITDHEAVLPGYKVDMQPNFPAGKLFWYVLHGVRSAAPANAYSQLPRWAKRQVDEIRK